MANTKSVGFRLSIQDYADLVNKAKSSKLSMSEYIISKVYATGDDDRSELIKKNEMLEKEIFSLRKKAEDNAKGNAELKLKLKDEKTNYSKIIKLINTNLKKLYNATILVKNDGSVEFLVLPSKDKKS